MTSLPLVTVAVCLFVGAYGWGENGQAQYYPAYPFPGYHYGFPSHGLGGRQGGQGRPGRQGMGGNAGQGMGGNNGQGMGGNNGQGMGGNNRQGMSGKAGNAGNGGNGSSGKNGKGKSGNGDQKLPVPEKYVNPQDAVAFSGKATKDQSFYNPGPVLFDDVITNIGGGYNPEYGVFTAPVPGIYSIDYNVQSKPGSQKNAHVDLVKNGEVINSAKAQGECASASNSAVLYLDQFDTVSVQGREGTVLGCESGLCSFNVVLSKAGEFTDQKIPRAMPKDKW